MAVRNWTSELTRGSHREVLVLCDWQFSENCAREWRKEWKTVVRDRERGDGTDSCMACSRARKSGANNPNCRYPDLDEERLRVIDTEAKAYLLGWVASDGSLQPGQLSLEVHRRDHLILEDLASLFSNHLPVVPRKNGNHVAFSVSRQKVVTDACRHLGVEPGPKSRHVNFPKLDPGLEWHFIRGLFDGDGSIKNPQKKGATSPACRIASTSPTMREALQERTREYEPRLDEGAVSWEGINALDFLGRLYEDATWRLERKHGLFQDWCTWLPQLGGTGNQGFERPLFYWSRMDPDGVAPHKSRVSDSGYDLTLIGGRQKDAGNDVRLYRTGIRVSPLHGWYFDMVPRSSISKTGYMLANSVGVIDRAYRGEILVPLRKVDSEAPDLTFPCRLVQLIPRPVVHVEFEELDDLDVTERGQRGFGSTGKT